MRLSLLFIFFLSSLVNAAEVGFLTDVMAVNGLDDSVTVILKMVGSTNNKAIIPFKSSGTLKFGIHHNLKDSNIIIDKGSLSSSINFKIKRSNIDSDKYLDINLLAPQNASLGKFATIRIKVFKDSHLGSVANFVKTSYEILDDTLLSIPIKLDVATSEQSILTYEVTSDFDQKDFPDIKSKIVVSANSLNSNISLKIPKILNQIVSKNILVKLVAPANNINIGENNTVNILVKVDNKLPKGKIVIDKTTGYSPLKVSVHASDVFDEDGYVVKYEWIAPDGRIYEGENQNFDISIIGNVQLSLRLTDNQGGVTILTQELSILPDSVAPFIVSDFVDGEKIITKFPTFVLSYIEGESGLSLEQSKVFLNGIEFNLGLEIIADKIMFTVPQDSPLSDGLYSIKFKVFDRAGNSSELLKDFEVMTGEIFSSYITGTVKDEEGPIIGARIEFLEAPINFLNEVAVTDNNGRFKLLIGERGSYRVYITKDIFTPGYKNVEVIDSKGDVDTGVITLKKADNKITQVDLSVGGVAANSDGSAILNIPEGSGVGVENFSITNFKEGASLPAALPELSAFTYAVAPVPFSVEFNKDVELLVENDLGFAVGTDIVVGFVDPAIGRWIDSGRNATIVETSLTKKFFTAGTAVSFPTPLFTVGDLNQPTVCRGVCTPAESKIPQGPKCNSKVTCCPSDNSSPGDYVSGSLIETKTGFLELRHILPASIYGNESYAPELIYRTKSVYPSQVLTTYLTNIADKADRSSVTFSSGANVIQGQYVSLEAGQSVVQRGFIEAKNADGKFLESGTYNYSITSETHYVDSEYATALFFGAPARTRLGVLARIPVTIPSVVSGRFKVVNNRNSIFGAGWTFGFIERLHLHEDRTRPIMLEDRFGELKLFNPYIIAQEGQAIPKRNFAWSAEISSISTRNGITLATDCINNSVYRIMDDGSFVIVAGNGSRGFSGDEGPATKAQLNCPMYAYPAERGGFYIADSDNFRIRKVSRDGIIRTIAGTGEKSNYGFDSEAIKSSIGRPIFITEDKLFSVFFINEQKQINFINPRGILENYSSQSGGYIRADLLNPKQILFDKFDNPIVVDSNKILNYEGKSLSSRDLLSLDNMGLSQVFSGEIESVSYDENKHSYYLLDSEGNMYAWSPDKKYRSLVKLNKENSKVRKKIKSFVLIDNIPLYIFNDNEISSYKTNESGVKYVYVSEFGESDEVEVLYENSGGISIKRNVAADNISIEYGIDGYITSLKSPSETILYSYVASGRPRKISSSKGWEYNLNYNMKGQVSGIVDGSGRETKLVINSSGDLIEIINPDSSKKVFEYDEDHLASKETREDNETSEFRYNKGRLTQEIYSGNRVRNFEPADLRGVLYESDTNVREHVGIDDVYSLVPDKSGKCSWKIYYDNYDNILKKVDCLGNETNFTNEYFEDKHVLRSIDANGVEKEYTYSIDGKISSTCKKGIKKSFEYNSQGQLTKSIDGDGNFIQTNYNEIGLPIEFLDQYGQKYSSEYDENKNIIRSSNPLASEVTYAYDEKNNLVEIKDTLGNIVRFERNDFGQVFKIIDPLNFESFLEYDLMGRVTKTIDQIGNETIFQYDGAGRLISLIDSNSNETKFEYGQYGLLYKQIDPLLNFEIFEYNENENISKKILKSGDEISYHYDLKSRLLQVRSIDDEINFSYAANNYLEGIVRNGVSIDYQYKDNGQLDSEKVDFFDLPLKYTYDSKGLVKTKSFGDKIHFEYFYDKRSSLSQITLKTKFGAPKEFNWVRGRDIIGRPIEDISFNDTLTNYSYDSNNQLLGLEHLNQSDKIVSKFEYDYSKTGNIMSKKETHGLGDDQYAIFSYLYNYDNSSRLIEASFENIHALDSLGNKIGAEYLHNANNQLLESPSWVFEYDLNGNLRKKIHKQKSLIYNYSWSRLGKLVSIDIDENSQPSKSLRFRYDGLSRRIEKQFIDFKMPDSSYIKRFVYDNEDIILELDELNQVRAVFMHGEGIDDPLMMIRDENSNQIIEDSEVYGYTKDHLGSVREISDIAGNIKQRYTYSSSGETKIGKINLNDKLIDSPYGFTSRELDVESGDYFYRARYYDPSTGRFMSKDPIGFAGGDTNLYRYVANDPVNKIDPSGLDWIFSQSTGQIYQVGADGNRIPGTGGQGYSGAPGHVNNPASQNLQDLGPLPQGTYTIGQQQNISTSDGRSLRSALRLTPNQNNNMFGRGGFIIHGDNRSGNQSASQGCPVLGPSIRNQIGNSNDNVLRVGP